MKSKIMILFLVSFLMTISTALAADKLIIKNKSGDSVVTLKDEGRIMVGTDTWSGASWAGIYGVNEDHNAGFEFRSYADGSTKGGGLLLTFARGSVSSPQALQNGDRLGFALFGGYDGESILNTAGLTAKVDGAVSQGTLPTKFAFETNAHGYPRYERMTISSAGTVKIGNGEHDPAVLLYVGNAYSDGTGWYTASSREFKEEIEKLDPMMALKTLDQLEPVTFRYKNQQNWDRKRIGFIAEDMPDSLAVPGKKAVVDVDILATLTLVVKEQQKELTELKKQLRELEKRNMSMKMGCLVQ